MKVLLIGGNGYIGSKVSLMLERKKIEFLSVDNLIRDIEVKNKNLTVASYSNLDQDFLKDYSECIFLAGHSSVQMSLNDEIGAFNNNFLDLIELRKRFKGRFIYASSGSVYSRIEPELCNEDSPTAVPDNMYDYTKIAFDNYLRMSSLQGIGLRFGTVNGWSQSLRPDLMINYMFNSAKKDNQVNVLNLDSFRPILFIDDLVNGIEKILESKITDGIFNMCSFNLSIGEIAREVAKLMDVELIVKKDTSTYNFMMQNSKFETSFNYKFEGSINNIIESLHNEN
jgi:UDP-glucose 4-epimerase